MKNLLSRSLIPLSHAAALALVIGVPYMGLADNATEIQRYPFAMCSNGNILNNVEYREKMVDAGAQMCRTDITFSTVRPEPGNDPNQWNWSVMDTLRANRKTSPKLQWLVLLGYGAEWAGDPKYSDVEGPKYSAPQRGIDVRPVNDPANLYGHYVYETVKRYKDVTSFWESWNEPDLPGHHYFKGNGKDFFEYQRVCYLAAKKADPTCTVLFAGLCFPTFEGYLFTHGLKPPTPYPPQTCFFEEYLQECVKDPEAKKNNFYFDVANQHSYSRASDLYDYAAVIQKLMLDYLGEVKSVWITEMGSTDSPGTFGLSPDEYCDYMLQSYAWSVRAGVQKIFHFQLDNSNGHGLYTGMLGQPKPALTTYRDVLTKTFVNATFVEQLHGTAGVGFLEGNSPYTGGGHDGYDLFQFKSNDGKQNIFMAFADTVKDVTIRIPATKKQAVLIDRHNQRTTITAHDGAYEVALAGATNIAGWPSGDNADAKALGNPEHLVGGATMVVVE